MLGIEATAVNESESGTPVSQMGSWIWEAGQDVVFFQATILRIGCLALRVEVKAQR